MCTNMNPNDPFPLSMMRQITILVSALCKKTGSKCKTFGGTSVDGLNVMN